MFLFPCPSIYPLSRFVPIYLWNQWINTGGDWNKNIKKTDYPKAQILHHNVGTCLWRKHWKTIKIVNEVKISWRLVAVGNGVLWLTPCKRMKLRRSEWAQLGDCTKESMSLVEGRLWSRLLMLPRPTVSDAHHYTWANLQAALASELAWS